MYRCLGETENARIGVSVNGSNGEVVSEHYAVGTKHFVTGASRPFDRLRAGSFAAPRSKSNG